MSGQATAGHTAKCLRCGHKLTTSAAAGYGPVCRRRIRDAAHGDALNEFHDWQITKAKDAIEQQAVVPMSRPGVYAATSSGGPVRKADPEPITVYIVDAIERSCTCKAAGHGHRCYHLAAAIILYTAGIRPAAATMTLAA